MANKIYWLDIPHLPLKYQCVEGFFVALTPCGVYAASHKSKSVHWDT